MTKSTLQSVVDAERAELLEGKDGIEKAIITRPHRGQTVAIGLLALDEVDAANDWFQALTEEWPVYANSKWDSKYESEPRSPASLGPWGDYIDGLFAALLARQTVDEIAATVYERATEPFVDRLEKREFAHRIDFARALSSLILGNVTVETHLDRLEQNVAKHGSDWDQARYVAYTRCIRAILAGHSSEAEAGIEALLEFHRDHVASARDADPVQKAVALDGTVMLALARREGVAITVDHERIPDALNDDEYYPVGE
ncbi:MULTISPECIES: Imm49 family immunity protein [Haloarcula]|uniref:Imm49 family immunity protein n=1 Tax=Haloarcula TaxID=2237 RepID=UPI000F8E99E9|nr:MULTISPECIES: Imm49 family immunity protein [Haloarcula]NHX41661.1 hypothetical protein [Haloarcula sp. R1-2]